MDINEDLPVYDDGGTSVVRLKKSDLLKFIITIEECERRGYGAQEGIFKMSIDKRDRRGGTSLPELLNILQKEIGESCILQEFRRYPQCKDVFGYKEKPANLCVARRNQFVKRMLSLSSYNTSRTETCCSKILDSDNGIADVVGHYFKLIQSCSVLKSSERAKPIGVNADFQDLIRLGVDVKAEYELSVSSLASGSKLESKARPVFDLCSCNDCFTESDSEDELDSGTTDVVRQMDECVGFEEYPMYSHGIQLDTNNVKVVKEFGLSDIYSVLNVLPQNYRGLTLPYFYVGEEHSSFAAHFEDAALWSANYMHFGFAKVWICIPPPLCEKVAELLRGEVMELAHTSCFNSLSHKYYVPTLGFLETHGIRYSITVQHPGEFIILYPRTIHLGFCVGPSLNEAVNFGTKSWIEEGVKARKWRCRCFGDSQIHLDMKVLVAAFFPNKLQELFNDHLHQPKSNPKQDDKPTQKSRKVKIFACPCPGCKTTFKEHRQRLADHIKLKHSLHVKKYIEEMEEIYPKGEQPKSHGRECPVCGNKIFGSVTHLEKHMIAQKKNPTSTLDVRLKYTAALSSLQATVRRRMRVKKQIMT